MTSLLTWPAAKIPDTIERDEAHVWAWPLDLISVDVTEHAALLDDAEQQRMQRFYFDADRGRYALAHAHMRRILGAYLNMAPQSIAFRTGAFGKPELVNPLKLPGLSFSLSHSKSVAALGIVGQGPVGLDIEDVRPIEPEVATSHFSAAEVGELNTLRGDAWLAGFYRCWTRKEAILKGEGVGLQRALDGFDVSLLPGVPPAVLGSRVPFQYSWMLYDASPSAGTMGALATAEEIDRVSFFRFVG